jgi:hypothetical protein
LLAVDRVIDHAARKQVTSDLGHSRISITSCYLCSSKPKKEEMGQKTEKSGLKVPKLAP